MPSDNQLEQMKQKYASVLKAIKQQQIRLSHLHIQDNKLFIQGVAPSDQAKNKVWDQIKQVNPSWSQELSADITVDPNAEPAQGEGSPPVTIEQDYSQVTQRAQPSHLASGLAEAFRSDQTPAFSQMLGTLFSNSTGQQRAGILSQLLGAVGPGMLASVGLSSLAGLLQGGNKLTPEQADQIPPDKIQQLAEHAEKQNPSIVDRASEFYAQHPTLVQALGAGSLALIMSRLSKK